MSEDQVQLHPYLHFIGTFIAGGTSAATALTLTAPIERIKLILQTQHSAHNIPKEEQYKGIIDCIQRIPKEQGFVSFWRGNVASIMRTFPQQALNFSFRELFKEKLITHSDGDSVSKKLFGNVLCGGLAGTAALTIIYPLDFARTRMAIDTGGRKNRQIKGVNHCLTQVVKHSGLRGVYTGYVFAALGAFIYRALYFGIFDTIMECVRPQYAHSLWIEFPVAEISATFAGIVSYPIDTVRRRMMLQTSLSGEKVKIRYSSTMDCMRKIWRTEGLRGYFHGGLANMYRGTGGAITLCLYDHLQHWMFSDHPVLHKYFTYKYSTPNGYKGQEDGEQADFHFNSSINQPCKVFKDRCVFCNL